MKVADIVCHPSSFRNVIPREEKLSEASTADFLFGAVNKAVEEVKRRKTLRETVRRRLQSGDATRRTEARATRTTSRRSKKGEDSDGDGAR